MNVLKNIPKIIEGSPLNLIKSNNNSNKPAVYKQTIIYRIKVNQLR